MIQRCALIRHGAYEQLSNTPSALQPYGLTVSGEQEVRRQAQEFAQFLETSGLRLHPVIDCSTLLRAWQTANIYKEELAPYFQGDVTLSQLPCLCERSVGAVANLTIDEIERILELDPRFSTPSAGWKSDSHYCLPFDGAESLMQAGDRVAQHITQWQAAELKHASGQIKLFVGHGAAMRHAAFHLNVIPFCDIKKLSMHYGHPVVLEFSDSQQPPAQLYGDWKHRQIHDVPD